MRQKQITLIVSATVAAFLTMQAQAGGIKDVLLIQQNQGMDGYGHENKKADCLPEKVEVARPIVVQKPECKTSVELINTTSNTVNTTQSYTV